MKRSGRRVAAVSMITGGLLMLGLAPAVADGGVDATTNAVVAETEETATSEASPTATRTAGPLTAPAPVASPGTDETEGGEATVAAAEPGERFPEVCDNAVIPPPFEQQCQDLFRPAPDPPDDEPPTPPVPDPCALLPDSPGCDDGPPPDNGNGNGNGGGHGGGNGHGNGGTEGGTHGDGSVPGGGSQGGPGHDAEQAEPEGVVPGAEAQPANPGLVACDDPSLCQELEEEPGAGSFGDTVSSLADELAETGAQVPVPAGVLAGAGAILLVGGTVLMRAQTGSRGTHRA
jgi:hypothetical protein